MSGVGAAISWRMRKVFSRAWQALDRRIESRFSEGNASADRAIARQFGGDAAAIEEAPVPVSAHAALYAVVAILIIALLWSIFGTLDRIVVAQGKIATRTPTIVLQPFTTSRVMQIRVKPGDTVRQGQVLVTFDPAFAAADQATMEQKLRASTAESDRIAAELAGAKSFPVAAGDSAERATQAQIFTQEMSAFQSEMVQRDSQARAIDAQLKAVTTNIEGLRNQLAIAQKVMSIQTNLQSEQAAAELDVLRAQNAQIDAESRLRSAIADEQRYSQQRAQLEAERQSFTSKWRSDHNQQLVQARQQLAEAQESLNKARRMKDYADLTAPVDATVLEIADRSVGSVMREGETLVTLVPNDAPLYVEANVPSRDVSYVRAGSSVRLKLETYPFQRYGTLDGVLDVISADSVPLKRDDNALPQYFYRAQVRVTTPPKELAKRGINLRPGLVATAEIKTGKRSIISYILEPVLKTANESMNEP